MSANKRVHSELNLSFIVGIALKPLPLMFFQPILKKAIQIMQNKHPAMFERLAEIENPTFLIDVVDIPFSFFMKIEKTAPELIAIPKDEYIPVSATIRGRYDSLIKMLEGKLDGDAAFFSRELVIEGKTEAIVALRNAVDSENINVIKDLLSFLGPLNKFISPFVKKGLDAKESINSTLTSIGDAILSKVSQDLAYQEQKIYELDERVTELTKTVSRNTRPPIRKKENIT